jgi:hypothetical protein
MNHKILIKPHSIANLSFYICNLYDNIVTIRISLNQGLHLWAVKLEYLKKRLPKPKKLLNLQLTPRNSEKLNRFSCQRFLVSIWSQLLLLLAAPRPPYVVFKLNFAPGQRIPRNNAAAAGARTCPWSKKRNCLNPFSKKQVKAKRLIRPKSIAPMNRLSAKRSRHQRFIGCWPATDGAHHVHGVQKIKIESHHGLFKQTQSANQGKPGLVYASPKPSRGYCCRPYLCAFGGRF